jgi:hypothetical protein
MKQCGDVGPVSWDKLSVGLISSHDRCMEEGNLDWRSGGLYGTG